MDENEFKTKRKIIIEETIKEYEGVMFICSFDASVDTYTNNTRSPPMNTRIRIYEYQKEGINSLEKKEMISVCKINIRPNDKGWFI